MIRAIADDVDPEQVILFGSRARGSARYFGCRPARHRGGAIRDLPRVVKPLASGSPTPETKAKMMELER